MTIMTETQALVQQLTEEWRRTIPVSQFMQIKPLEYANNVFKVSAPLEPNINCHNTMFAGSLSSLATLTGWGAVWLEQKLQQVDGNAVLADGHIRCFAPVSGSVIAQVTVEKMDLSRLKLGKKQLINLQVEILCNDKVCAVFEGTYVSLPLNSQTQH